MWKEVNKLKKVDIIGGCSDFGVHINGTKSGPLELEKKIDKSLVNNISNVMASEKEKEHEKSNLQKNLNEVNSFNEKLYNKVLDSLNEGHIPLTLGGDHSIAIASGLASIKKHSNLGIIWFDAHGDFNTFETTSSGNIHGLPFAVLCNYEKKLLSSFHNGAFYNPKNAVLVGARDIDEPGELDNLKKAGVTIFTTEDIKNLGTDFVYSKAFEIASNGTNGIHISFDLDVIDPNLAPGVSIPATNGINLDEAYSFVNAIIKNKEKIKSIDLVELNPLNDIEHKTQEIAQNILESLIRNLN